MPIISPAYQLASLEKEWNRRDVQLFLRKILTNPEKFLEVCNRSYIHQLGFEKYVLEENTAGLSLRLHHWPNGSNLQDEDIHSHCASFTSTVLLGSLTNEIYELRPGSTHRSFTYRFNHHLKHSEISGGKVTAINQISQSTSVMGCTYMLDAHTLHRVTKVTPGTTTISMWNKRLWDAVVVKSLEVQPEDCVRHAGLPPSFVYERVEHILEALK